MEIFLQYVFVSYSDEDVRFDLLCQVNSFFHKFAQPLLVPWLKRQLPEHAVVEPSKDANPFIGILCKNPSWCCRNEEEGMFPFLIAPDPIVSSCGTGAIYRLELRKAAKRASTGCIEVPIPRVARMYSWYRQLQLEVGYFSPCKHLRGVVNCADNNCLQHDRVFWYIDPDGNPRPPPLEPLELPPAWLQGRYSIQEVGVGSQRYLELKFFLYEMSMRAPKVEELNGTRDGRSVEGSRDDGGG